MANHASGDDTVALYETDRSGNAILYLREGKSIAPGDEVTITYGDNKGACEMLFSYGFLESNMTSARELFLDIQIPEDDPLRVAKQKVSQHPPGFRLFLLPQGDGEMGWEGPFIWLACVNEEDGLEFKVLQQNDGVKELKVSWQDTDIQNISELQNLLKAESLWDVFHLRALSILQSRIQEQIQKLEYSGDFVKELSQNAEYNRIHFDNAMRLRDLEEAMLLEANQYFRAKVMPAEVVS